MADEREGPSSEEPPQFKVPPRRPAAPPPKFAAEQDAGSEGAPDQRTASAAAQGGDAPDAKQPDAEMRPPPPKFAPPPPRLPGAANAAKAAAVAAARAAQHATPAQRERMVMEAAANVRQGAARGKQECLLPCEFSAVTATPWPLSLPTPSVASNRLQAIAEKQALAERQAEAAAAAEAAGGEGGAPAAPRPPGAYEPPEWGGVPEGCVQHTFLPRRLALGAECGQTLPCGISIPASTAFFSRAAPPAPFRDPYSAPSPPSHAQHPLLPGGHEERGPAGHAAAGGA